MMIGETIGHFRILEKLGAGGMGEVYKAEDLRLGRQVALKLLPASLLAQRSARERFEREARAIAALNHPHICVLHEAGEAALAGQAEQPYLVLELLEGQTLREKIHGQPQTLAQILTWGIELSDALDAAHQRGLVHRDLKPANIFITRRGQAKILDFGLARLLAAAPAGLDTEAETINTLPAPLTSPGMALGTVAYMAPEQARGEAADARSDLFSLGAILFEMAAGRQLYQGKSAAETFKQILADPAPALRTLRPDLPAELEAILAKTLEKEPELRCQTAAELRADLKRLERASTARAAAQPAATPATSAITTMAPAAAVASAANSSDSQIVSALLRRHQRGLMLGALAAAIAAAGLIFWLQQRSAAGALARAWQHPTAQQFTSSGNIQIAAISPNGQYIAYIRQTRQGLSLWLHQSAAPGGVEVLAPGAHQHYYGLEFTPDSNYLDFLAGNLVRPELFQIPVLGGQPRQVLADIESLPAFSPGGRRFAYTHCSNARQINELRIAAADSGDSQRLAAAPAKWGWACSSVGVGYMNSYQAPTLAWSPGGHRLYCKMLNLANIGKPYLGELDMGSRRVRQYQAPGEISNLAALPGSRRMLAIVAAQIFFSAPQIEELDEPPSKATSITNGLAAYTGLSLTADGRTLATVEHHYSSSIWVWPPQQTTPQPWLAASSNLPGISGMAWGPDKTLVFSRKQGEENNLWRAKWGSNAAPTAITRGKFARNPVFSAHGRRVFYINDGQHQSGVWEADLEGNAERNLHLYTPGIFLSPHGRALDYLSAPKQHLYRLSLSSGRRRRLTTIFIGMALAPQLAPDGQRLLFEMHDPATHQAVAAIMKMGDPRQIKYFPLRKEYAWAPGAKALSFVRMRQGMENIWLQPLRDDLPAGPARQLTHFRRARIGQYAWAKDGTLAIVRLRDSANVVLLHAKPATD